MKMKTNQSLAWTTSYRPISLSQLHQVSVRNQLIQYQNEGSFPQVLLFAGPKGTGKTTSARIIAALLNDPKNTKIVTNNYIQHQSEKKALSDPDVSNELIAKILTGTSFTVHELDAASNRGINEMRAIKDQAQLSPIEGIISVFILDEVHMLTAPAFNALLKLLEEPPSHTTFILATTELQKIPETVVSRCQVVHFHQASQAEIQSALEFVTQSESLQINADVLARVADLANGSFRDAVKYLQKIATYKNPTLDLVEALIAPSFSARIDSIITALLDKDSAMICKLFVDLRSEVYDEKLFITQLLETIHQDLLLHYLPELDSQPVRTVAINLFLLKEFTQSISYPPNPIPFLSLEITCLNIIERSQQKTKKGSGDNGTTVTKKITPQRIEVNNSSNSKGDAQKLLENWQRFLTEVANHNTTLAALFRSAQPKRANDHSLEIEVYYQFHKEQLINLKHHAAIQPVLNTLVGGDVHFDISVVTAPVAAELLDEVPTSLPERVAAALLQSDPHSATDVVQSN